MTIIPMDTAIMLIFITTLLLAPVAVKVGFTAAREVDRIEKDHGHRWAIVFKWVFTALALSIVAVGLLQVFGVI